MARRAIVLEIGGFKPPDNPLSSWFGCVNSSQIELIHTQELLRRYLPPPPAVVYDVGGGAGIYAFWLAERGYTVHLLDAVPRHIDQAREAAQTKPDAPLAGIAVGDARQLEYADATADGVLLFGPLYHLTEQADRLQALREAHRVLRTGGVVMAVGISRFTSTINGLLEGAITDPLFRPIMERDLLDGQHRNPTNDPAYFTTTFFHHPDELLAEVAAAGFEGRIRLAVEGPARLLKAFQTGWQDEAQRAWLLLAPELFYDAYLSDEEVKKWAELVDEPVFHYGFQETIPLNYGHHQDGLRYVTPPPAPVPIMLIHGLNDQAVPIEHSRKYAADYPDKVRLIEVESNHFLDDQHDLIWKYVQELL